MHLCNRERKPSENAVLSQIVHALIKESSSGRKISVRYMRGGTHLICNEISSQMRSPTHAPLVHTQREQEPGAGRRGQASVALQMNGPRFGWGGDTRGGNVLESLRTRANVSSCALLTALLKDNSLIPVSRDKGPWTGSRHIRASAASPHGLPH